MKVIFVPGNGGESSKDNWFPYLKEAFHVDVKALIFNAEGRVF